jgi:hypothetical protein
MMNGILRTLRYVPYVTILFFMLLFYGGAFLVIVLECGMDLGVPDLPGFVHWLLATIVGLVYLGIPSFVFGIGLVFVYVFQKIVSPILIVIPFLLGILMPLALYLLGDTTFPLWFGLSLLGPATIITLILGYRDLALEWGYGLGRHKSNSRRRRSVKQLSNMVARLPRDEESGRLNRDQAENRDQ